MVTNTPINQIKRTCKNCGNNFEGKYCNQCGQKVVEERYTVKHIFNLLIASFDINRGFFYTAKWLLLNPAKVLKDYLGGRTKDYTNPLKYLFILVGVSALITVWSNVFDSSVNTTNELMGTTNADSLQLQVKVMNFMKKYLNIFTILFIPFYSLISKWLLRKHKQFYAEHLILNSYLYAQYVLINFIPLFIVILFPQFIDLAKFAGIIVFTIYYTYALKSIYKLSVLSAFVKSVLIFVLGLIIIVVLSMIIMILFMILWKLAGGNLEALLN